MKLPSSLVLLRIHYSYYHIPVFLFAVAFMENPHTVNLLILFGILHLLLYPASYGFNSFMDKDQGSVGGLRHPPVPTLGVLIISLLLYVAAIGVSYWLNPNLSLLVAAYALASIAYSWHPIRLKKYAITGFVTAALFQGFIVFSMVYLFGQEVDYLSAIGQTNYLEPALMSSLLVAASFPMTQIYQHIADKHSGDMTLSRILGIRGTFQFSVAFYALVSIWIGFFLTHTNQSHLFYLFISFLFPVLAFYAWWAYKVWADPTQANYRYTLIYLNISSTALILYFLLVHGLRLADGLPV